MLLKYGSDWMKQEARPTAKCEVEVRLQRISTATYWLFRVLFRIFLCFGHSGVRYGHPNSQVVPPIVKGDQTVVLSITEAGLVVKLRQLRLNILLMPPEAFAVPSKV